MRAPNELFCFLAWPFPETAMGILCNCLNGALPYTWYTLRDTITSLVRSLGSPPLTNHLTRQPAMATAKNKRHPGCPVHAVIGVFYSVVANRRQPNLYSIPGIHMTGQRGVLLSLSCKRYMQGLHAGVTYKDYTESLHGSATRKRYMKALPGTCKCYMQALPEYVRVTRKRNM